MHRRFTVTLAALAALSLLASACGGNTAPGTEQPPDAETPTTDPSPGEPGAPVDPDPSWEDFPTDDAREEARGLLGMNEDDLTDDVRVSRRGDEHFMLTEDYVLGRRTVELDDVDGSGYRVITVTVELPDGPETFVLQGG